MALLMIGGGVERAGANADQPGDGRGSRRAGSARCENDFEIYGFAMLDIGQNFKQINPNWFDTMRVTKLPSLEEPVR